jgi:hypothetical protein
MSTATLNHCYKLGQLAPTMWLTRFIYVRSVAFKSTSKLLPGSRLVFGSLHFIVDNMRYLSLQDIRLCEIDDTQIDVIQINKQLSFFSLSLCFFSFPFLTTNTSLEWCTPHGVSDNDMQQPKDIRKHEFSRTTQRFGFFFLDVLLTVGT